MNTTTKVGAVIEVWINLTPSLDTISGGLW
jgi:hypothetical protein